MPNSGQSFRDFEQAGWEDENVVSTYHEYLSTVTTQSVDVLLDAVGVGQGTRVLDVATGAGYVAGAAAQRGADATGIDFSIAQVRMARGTYPAIRFEHADAEALPFEAETFDAVVNAFGMCHVPNPVAALREAFRVLKPGGHMGFMVWDYPERSVGFGATYDAIRAHGSMDVGLPEGPDFFLFTDPAYSEQTLIGLGFESPSCRVVPQFWRMTNPDTIFHALTRGTVRAGAILRGQSEDTIDAIRDAMRDIITSYRRDDYYVVPMPGILVSAIKPGQ